MTANEEWLDNWNARKLDGYRTELAAGHHDADCEQRERFGMCGCRQRKRLAEGRTTPPTLIHNYPTCTGCHRDVWHDGDGFVCSHCHATWPSNAGEDEPATFDDEHGDLSASTEDRFGRRLIELVS